MLWFADPVLTGAELESPAPASSPGHARPGDSIQALSILCSLRAHRLGAGGDLREQPFCR